MNRVLELKVAPPGCNQKETMNEIITARMGLAKGAALRVDLLHAIYPAYGDPCAVVLVFPRETIELHCATTTERDEVLKAIRLHLPGMVLL
jgi:hypothetical protein